MTDSKAISWLRIGIRRHRRGLSGAALRPRAGPPPTGAQRATVQAVFGVGEYPAGPGTGAAAGGRDQRFVVALLRAESLRFSLEVVSLLGFWPAVHLYRLARRRPVDETIPATA
ncbi:MAG: hypothetical protein WDN04_17080 [Rhodospirillales bacterium]